MSLERNAPAVCLVFSPASGRTDIDEAIVAQLKYRIWGRGHTLFEVNDRIEAEPLILEHGDKLAAIFVVAKKSCYSTWAFVGANQARKVAQFVITRFRLEEGIDSIISSPSRIVEMPAGTPDIHPLLDRELNEFFQTFSASKDSPPPPGIAPAAPVPPLPVPQTSIAPRCSAHEVTTLDEIGAADEHGISLVKLGRRLNELGIVQTMSLSINGLKRKGLIQFQSPHSAPKSSGYVERKLCVSAAGRLYLEQRSAPLKS